MKKVIYIGKKIFEFTSYTDWNENASNRFEINSANIHNSICIDIDGRVCATGNEFKRADDEDTYPISVYLINDEDN